MQCSKPGYVKRVPLVNGRYTKGVNFLLKVGFVREGLDLSDEPSLITNFVNTHMDILLIFYQLLREGFCTK